MIVPLPGGEFVNVAHISMVSGIQPAPNQPNLRIIRILLMGRHEHVVRGSEENLTALYRRLRAALDQIGNELTSE